MDLKDKIHKLKSSFSIEGTPLIYSDRFSTQDIFRMKEESTAHKYHWQHMESKSRIWTDKEIEEQIELFMSINLIEQENFNAIVENLLKRLPFKDKESEKITFITTLKIILKIENCVPVKRDFWRNFGSAPYYIDSGNKKLVKYKTLYGAIGMHELFGEERFSIAHHLIYAVDNAVSRFDIVWENHIEDLEMQSLTSEYKSLDDLEDNVVAKKKYKEARKFYHDKSKDFKQRIKVFSKYGDEDSSIYSPKNSDLNSIFEMHTEGDMYQRHEMVDTINIVESWVDSLSYKRLKLNWKNPYHPKLVETERNYKPSTEAINRLRVYYLEKLMLEETSSFEFDW